MGNGRWSFGVRGHVAHFGAMDAGNTSVACLSLKRQTRLSLAIFAQWWHNGYICLWAYK
jgi:hypothetical protein